MENPVAVHADQLKSVEHQLSQTLDPTAAESPHAADFIREEDMVPSDEDDAIRSLLDEFVRPAVEQDGGAIDFKAFKDGTVYVHMRGACSGCPSSMQTLKGGIEQLLTSKLPSVKEVVALGV
jgi:Fe-S cluster biogenesis protein NfuA